MKRKYTKDERIFGDLNMRVTKHRDRIGCDICKQDIPTNCFVGWKGNVIWVCGNCFKELITNKA